MSKIEFAVRRSQRLEKWLKAQHGAEGRGLHELVDSVESQLDPADVRDLRFVAAVRNAVVHENEDELTDQKRDRIEQIVERVTAGSAERTLLQKAKRAFITVIVVAMLIAAAWWRLRN